MVAPSVPLLTDLASGSVEQPSPSLTIRTKKVEVQANEMDSDHSGPATPPQVSEQGTISLEERVAELESKIATLSHLLAARRYSATVTSSPPPAPRVFLPISPACPESPSLISVPPLESPYPNSMSRRRLSDVLLRQDSNPSFLSCPNLSDDEKFVLEQKEPPEPEPKSVQQKWMDYLESFQESTPNVDVQMEEFVRVPWQLEYLLNFGFYICVDSFLYIITVLPLKFLWSILLMVSSWTGKYRFHRRSVMRLVHISLSCL
jgi:hypothetical protein